MGKLWERLAVPSFLVSPKRRGSFLGIFPRATLNVAFIFLIRET